MPAKPKKKQKTLADCYGVSCEQREAIELCARKIEASLLRGGSREEQHAALDRLLDELRAGATRITDESSVHELDMDIRIANTLESEGILTIGHLRKALASGKLLRITQIGPKAIDACRQLIWRLDQPEPGDWQI